MSIKNRISISCLLLVLVCWVSFFSFYELAMVAVIAAPVFALVGFIVSVSAVRSKQNRVLSVIMLCLHSVVIVTYTAGFIYMAFFWNPRFF
ncbi:MAG: hypothetical protein HYZ14_09280 [Bacteroidetes bacterium]|nr:hypothetical protein [Bacteroidota bacterium]